MPSTKQTVAGLVLLSTGVLAGEPSCGESPCQSIVDQFPACAIPCIDQYGLEVAGCQPGDYACHCANIDAIAGGAALCVLGACNSEELGETVNLIPQMCECLAANPTVPCPTASPTDDAPPKPTHTQVCEDKEPCAVPTANACIEACLDPHLTDAGCNTYEDWNCYCANFRPISRNAFTCLLDCGADGTDFSNAAGRACDCIDKPCPSSSSSSSDPTPPPTPTTEPPVTTTTPPTTTEECPHPCQASVSLIPACATDCIVSAASAVGCGGSDFDCRCASAGAIQQRALGCVVGACGGIAGALPAAEAAASLCECVTASPATSCAGATTTTAQPTTTAEEPTTEPGDGPEETEAPCPSESFVTKTVEVTTSVCEDDGDEDEPTPEPSASPSCGPDGCGGGEEDDEDEGSGEDSDDEDGAGPEPSFPGGGDSPGDNEPTRTGGEPPVVTGGAGAVVFGSGLAGLLAAVAAFL